MRPIPSSGLCRPTRQCRKTRRNWADETDDDETNEKERDAHSLVDDDEYKDDDEDQCEWEIYGEKKEGCGNN